jgi:hypothetical protein
VASESNNREMYMGKSRKKITQEGKKDDKE